MNDALSCECNAVGREYAVKANCNYVVVIIPFELTSTDENTFQNGE